MDVAKVLLPKIISGYYTNYSGKIKINGEDMKKIPGNKIRSRIVYINQKDFLFDASPEENCTLFLIMRLIRLWLAQWEVTNC